MTSTKRCRHFASLSGARRVVRNSVLSLLGVGLLGMSCGLEAARADSVVLDFAGVAWPVFAGKAASDFEDAVLAIVVEDYSEFPWLTIAKGVPGAGDTVVEFAQFAGAGALGNAHVVDWDNKLTAQNDLIAANDAPGSAIDVFVPGFTGIGSPFTDTFARFTTAIGGTASHELGHGLGLRHFDTFGPASVAGNPTPVADNHIMATGSTGLAGTDRTDFARAFSEHSRDKLHYLDPANQPARKRAETLPGAFLHATPATAEPLTIGPADLIAAVGREIMVKSASIGAPGEADYFSFSASAGDRIYANVFSARLSDGSGLGTNPTTIDSQLALHKPDTTTIYLNDDIGYNATSAGSPGIGDTVLDVGGGLSKVDLLGVDEIYWGAADGIGGDGVFSSRTLDSILIDSPTGDYFTLTESGTWFLEVFAFDGADTGDYELFVSIERIPEPSTLLLATFGLITLLGYGRRRRNAR